MKKKVLITGANGFIGSFLVLEAIEKGLDVYAAVRKNSDNAALKNQNVQIITINFDDQTALVDLLKKYQFDYIIHSAGLTKSPSYEEFIKINKGLLVQLVTAINVAGVSITKLVFISSLAAYGPADFQQEKIVTDTSTPHPVTKYGKSKLEAEKYLRSQSKIPYVIIRPTAVYGPGEKDLYNVFKMINNRIAMVPALLGQKLTFIYVKDLANLILKATLSTATNKAYFVTDGHLYTGLALSGLIREIIEKKGITIKIPIFLMEGMAFVTEKAAGFWDSYPIFNTDKVNEIKALSWHCDVSNLRSDLDFEPKFDLPSGLRETVKWYKENKWL
ncbi:MAG: NAD(P)-dependent oxidoreductase [Saprospiraceae bacterium]|jgi:UDP-glucose 4-epimerase|nr:NAD(P)-dependent oxidoreductase [Saprospiraceae bacterium]